LKDFSSKLVKKRKPVFLSKAFSGSQFLPEDAKKVSRFSRLFQGRAWDLKST
jgi:hypothetical protein